MAMGVVHLPQMVPLVLTHSHVGSIGSWSRIAAICDLRQAPPRVCLGRDLPVRLSLLGVEAHGRRHGRFPFRSLSPLLPDR